MLAYLFSFGLKEEKNSVASIIFCYFLLISVVENQLHEELITSNKHELRKS